MMIKINENDFKIFFGIGFFVSRRHQKERNLFIKEFHKLLLRKQVYSQFLYNFYTLGGIWRGEWVDNNNAHICNEGEFLNYAFEWCRTKEGHSFWQKINVEWGKICANLREKMNLQHDSQIKNLFKGK